MTTNDTTTTPKVAVHHFTRHGMGPAPFRFLYACSIPSNWLAGENPEAYNNALRALPRDLKDGLGTCACCGMAIMNVFVVQNAIGEKWGVGCDCVMKTDDVQLVDAAKVERNKQARAKRAARKAERVAKVKATQEGARTLPSGQHAGLTAAEVAEQAPTYATWILERDAFPGLLAFRAELLATPLGMAFTAAREAEAARRLALQGNAGVQCLARLLADGMGGFRDSVAFDLRAGSKLTSRAAGIACEILAKQVARGGSKANAARYDECWTVLEQAGAIHE